MLKSLGNMLTLLVFPVMLVGCEKNSETESIRAALHTCRPTMRQLIDAGDRLHDESDSVKDYGQLMVFKSEASKALKSLREIRLINTPLDFRTAMQDLINSVVELNSVLEKMTEIYSKRIQATGVSNVLARQRLDEEMEATKMSGEGVGERIRTALRAVIESSQVHGVKE